MLLLLGIQANCASETWICLYAFYKTAHAAFDDFFFRFFIRAQPNAATKCVQKRAHETGFFYLKVATASALMSGDVLAMETIYNFYIRIT